MGTTQPLYEGVQNHLEHTETDNIPVSRRGKPISTVISWIELELLDRAETRALAYRDGPAGLKDRARMQEIYQKWKIWDI